MSDANLRREASLALHYAVAERLREHPELLSRARSRIQAWQVTDTTSKPLLDRWLEILDRPIEEILRQLTERSEEADWLRKASPFAGELPPRERERILRAVRGRFGSPA